MTENKTQSTAKSVDDFIASIEHPARRKDAAELNAMFQTITGFQPKIWGANIIGYGRYHYVYNSGREGDSLATGFSPRKANLVLYIMPGYLEMEGMLSRLGKHKLGKSCLYINKLSDVDMAVVEEIVRAGLKDLQTRWSVDAG